MRESSEPIELRPRATSDGRVDIATLRWTIEHMHEELAESSDLARVRNALAIALLEIDRVQHQSMAVTPSGPLRSLYLQWPTKS